MTAKEAEAKLEDFARRLRWWITETWMRAAEHPSSLEETNNCAYCQGSGKAHFCFTPGCKSTNLEDCVHPTAEEKQKLHALSQEYRVFATAVEAAAEKAKGFRGMEFVEGDLKSVLSNLLRRPT